MKKLPLVLLLFATTSSHAVELGSSAPKGIAGLWNTQDRDGIVELYSCEDHICGRFHWLQESKESPQFDVNNPNPKERDRRLCGLQFMGDFTPANTGKYESGWIYSPRHGSIFNANLELIDSNTLNLHGYLFIPALGESQTWTRAESNTPHCEIETASVEKAPTNLSP